MELAMFIPRKKARRKKRDYYIKLKSIDFNSTPLIMFILISYLAGVSAVAYQNFTNFHQNHLESSLTKINKENHFQPVKKIAEHKLTSNLLETEINLNNSEFVTNIERTENERLNEKRNIEDYKVTKFDEAAKVSVETEPNNIIANISNGNDSAVKGKSDTNAINNTTTQSKDMHNPVQQIVSNFLHSTTFRNRFLLTTTPQSVITKNVKNTSDSNKTCNEEKKSCSENTVGFEITQKNISTSLESTNNKTKHSINEGNDSFINKMKSYAESVIRQENEKKKEENKREATEIDEINKNVDVISHGDAEIKYESTERNTPSDIVISLSVNNNSQVGGNEVRVEKSETNFTNSEPSPKVDNDNNKPSLVKTLPVKSEDSLVQNKISDSEGDKVSNNTSGSGHSERVNVTAISDSESTTEDDYNASYEMIQDDEDDIFSTGKNSMAEPSLDMGPLNSLRDLAGNLMESLVERLVPQGLRSLLQRMQNQNDQLETIKLRSREENGGLGQFGRSLLFGLTSPLTQLMQGARDNGSLDADQGLLAGVASVANSLADSFKDRVRAIYPGTLWCGDGDMARSAEVGLFFRTDSCCRRHDACRLYILAGETKYGLTNTGIFTRSHCECDRAFYRCLKKTNTLISTQIGVTYFSILGPQCFTREYPIIKCMRRTRLTGQKCEEYEYDKSQPKMWQWFDNETF